MVPAKLLCACGLLSLALFQTGTLPHYTLKSLNSDDYADLAFLEPLLKDVRVVQLGENGHGIGEAQAIKARLARYLHARLGFTVLAFESSVYLCHRAEQEAATATAQSNLIGSLVGVWHTEEVLPIFEYVRGERASATPLRLAGFDVQPIGGRKKDRPAFFAALVEPIDRDYAKAVEALDQEFIAMYDKGGAARRAYFREQGAKVVEGFTRLASFLETHRASIGARAGNTAAVTARQEAQSMAAYVRYQSSSDLRAYAEIRDEAMAANVLALLNDAYPREKIIVWGHDYHVREAGEAIPPEKDIFPGVPARTMGSWLKEALGERLFTVGVYAHHGLAVDNGRSRYEIPIPGADMLESRLAESREELLFVDLRAAAATSAGTWLRAPVRARFNGQTPHAFIPVQQYDALISIASVTPPKFLY